jgi:HK97 family phage major capsid protein
MDLSELADLIEAQGKAWQQFERENSARLKGLERDMQDIEKKSGRPGPGASDWNDGGRKRQPAMQTEHQKAFDRYLRKGDDSGLDEIQRKAMNTGSDPDGGYLVIPEMDQTIDRIAQTVAAMYRLASTVIIGTVKYERLVKTSGMAMRRVADGATGGETTEPKYAKVAIEVFTAEVEPWIYNETLEDSFNDLSADLAAEAGVAFAEGGAAEFITGNGVGKARGILAYTNVANSAFAWGSVGYTVSGATAGFAATTPADKLIDLVTALKPKYRNGASFLMNDTTLGVARQMKDASGQYYLWQADATKPFGGTLLGYPVEIDNTMPDIAAGAYAIAFGNFKAGYAIVNHTGTTLIRDNITAKGTTKFNFRRRFGGGIVNYEAIKLMKFATS